VLGRCEDQPCCFGHEETRLDDQRQGRSLRSANREVEEDEEDGEAKEAESCRPNLVRYHGYLGTGRTDGQNVLRTANLGGSADWLLKRHLEIGVMYSVFC
jgi:hypothetical protein